MTEISKEELLSKRGFSVGELKEWLIKNNVPDNAIFLTEIVDDQYFNGGFDLNGKQSNEWPVYLKERACGSLESTVRYAPIYCPVQYSEDKEFVFIDMHY